VERKSSSNDCGGSGPVLEVDMEGRVFCNGSITPSSTVVFPLSESYTPKAGEL
jgi:hypothetical protein